MNKKFTLFIIAAFTISFAAQAQKVKEKKISFTDTRLPLIALENLESYQFVVETPYAKNANSLDEMAQKQYEDALANYPNVVEESKRKYDQDLVNYDIDVEIARENFKIESDEYNKLSKLERLALKDQKPYLKMPRKPNYYKPAEPRYIQPNKGNIITFDPVILAKSHLVLEGYTRGETSNTLTGIVSMSEFEYLEPVRKMKEVSKYDPKTKQTRKIKTYYYLTDYKRPTHLVLEYKGEVLFDGMYEASNEYITHKSDNNPSVNNLEKNSVTELLGEINEWINDNYGKSEIAKTIDFTFIKNKKGDYDDLEDAVIELEAGLANYSFMQTNEELDATIAIWNSELEAYEPDDKKARINEKVAEAITFNLLELYTALNRIDEANSMVEKLGEFKLRFAGKERLKAIKTDIKDKAFRLKANGM